MNLTPTFSTGAIGRPTLDPEQERIARLLEALVTQTPGGLVQSTGETLGMVGDVLGSIGQPQRAEALGQQVRRTLPDIVSAVTQRPAEVATVFGQGMEQEVLDKGAGAVFGLEDLILPGGKALGMLGASAMAMGKLPPASKAAQDIVDLSKARQTPRQMRLQELANEQMASGADVGALERGRLKGRGSELGGDSAELTRLKGELNDMQVAFKQINEDRKAGKITLAEQSVWMKENGPKYEELKKQVPALTMRDNQRFDALEQARHLEGLDPIELARLDRAVEQGFDIDAYHGTKGDISEFDPGLLGATTSAPSARRGFFFSADPETAHNYARGASAEDLRPELKRQLNKLRAEADKLANARMKASEEISDRSSVPYEIFDEAKAIIKEKIPSSPAYIVENAANVEARGIKRGLFAEPISQYNAMIGLIKESGKSDLVNKIQNYYNAYLEKKQNIYEMDRKSYDLQDEIAATKKFTSDGKFFQNILPVKLRLQNPLEYDFGGKAYRDVTYNDLLKQAQEAGNDGAIFRNTTDGGGVTDIYVVFEPSQIRSRYAAFDPYENASGSLIANAPPILFPLGVGTAAAAYSANQEQ